jgi:hypothetical protein
VFALTKYAKQCTGIPIPLYPLVGDAHVQYAMAQQEAARTREFLMRHHNMEEDAFGFARFPRDPDPARDQVDVVQLNENTGSAQAEPASPSLESEYTS